MNNKYIALAACAAVALGGPASAGVVEIYPTDPSWSNLPGEVALGATAAITTTAPRSGNGSLEILGDRVRFATGAIYPNALTTPIIALDQVLGLTFEWNIAADSTSNYSPDYTPALRLHIWDAGASARKELIWEGAYNGTYGSTSRDTWYATTLSDKFYITGGDVNAGLTIANWASSLATGSFVSGISVGVGSGVGTGYHVFADNVTLATTAGDTIYNFETPVPEPASWAMLIGGFAIVGASLRRRSARVRFA